ncbi:MAG: hypothetical protein PWQ06_412 [Anaerophaga sp.]|jgi:hypothetical protein|nr:hypothetical protein [Anaerophaga sp.]
MMAVKFIIQPDLKQDYATISKDALYHPPGVVKKYKKT